VTGRAEGRAARDPRGIRLEAVSLAYRARGHADVVALRELSFHVEDNEFLSIVGPSGCGKSTLLRLVAGLLRPTGGRVELDGAAVAGPRRDVGIVFQIPLLLPWRTALENVLLPVEFLRLDVGQFRARARELLVLAGLQGFEDHYPRALSGGMQQRVGICRALIADPRVLVMDEPFGALDALTREELSLELLRIWEERKKTVVFVTHSIPEAVLLSNRVLVMTPRPGKVAGIVEVPLPRPRAAAMEFRPEFRAASEAIRALIDQGRRSAR
jgi:NitT/TauT family transport system ATP-binding protein